MLGDPGSRYELVERLAVRTATELFVVTVSGEHGFRRNVVLKRLRDDAHEAQFIEDAKLQAKLSHARIVQTLELGSVDDAPYVAIEYVDGVDLLGLVGELARRQRAFDPAIAVWIAQELLDALDYAHTHEEVPVVHGRLSPTKVLLGAAGEVKLCDFGVVRRLDLEAGGHDCGHLSPEQVSEQPVDPRSDVFGVGVLLAEMVGGRRLFAARNDVEVLVRVRDARIHRFEEITPVIDGELAGIVRRALEKKPEDRWASASLFRDVLDAWLFANRRSGMKQQLAALIGELRPAIDAWRRSGSLATPEFDAFDSSQSPPVQIALPRDVPAGVLEVAKPDRLQARGTVEPANDPLARGTERPAPRGAPPVRPEPRTYQSDPIPALPDKLARGATSVEAGDRATAHPRVRPRRSRPRSSGKLGLALEDHLPARAPASPRTATQRLTPEEIAQASQPTPPALAPLERTPDDSGDFARVPPLRVLFGLMRARATGLLAATAGTTRKDVYVRDGQLAGVWSTGAHELFGNYLVAQGAVSDGELAMALATMSHYGGKLGEALVGLGLMSHVEVFRQLTRHTRIKVVDICTWTAGDYAWFAGNQDPLEAFPLEEDGFAVLGEGLLATPAAVIDAWVAKHRATRLVHARVHRLSPGVFGVRSAENVAELIDGVRTVGAICDRHTDRALAGRLLYLFVACDIARPA